MTTLPDILRILCLVLFSAPVNAQIVWEAPTIAVDSGDVVGVDFTIQGYENIISAQGTIQFDETVLEYSHVDSFALMNMSNNSFGTTEVNIGLLSFSWYDASLNGQSIPDDNVVVRVFFDVIGNPGESSPIELVDQPVSVEFIDTSFSSVNHSSVAGIATINDSTASSLELMEDRITVYPNPALDWLQIDGLSDLSKVEVKLYQVNGSLVRDYSFGNMEKLKVPVEGLESGMYYLQVGGKSIGFVKRLIEIL